MISFLNLTPFYDVSDKTVKNMQLLHIILNKSSKTFFGLGVMLPCPLLERTLAEIKFLKKLPKQKIFVKSAGIENFSKNSRNRKFLKKVTKT